MEVINLYAVLIGVPTLVVGLSLLADDKKYGNICRSFFASPALMHISGLLTLLIGMLIVMHHNVWTDVTTSLISFTGWACLVKGAWILLSPKTMKKLQLSNKDVKVAALITVAIGAYLSIEGLGILI